LRVFFFKIASNRVQIARRLRDRHARFQSAQSRPTLMIVASEHPWFLCNFAQRQQHVRISAELKLGWEYAYDLALQSIDQRAPAKNGRRSTKIAAPEIFTDQCDVRRACHIVCCA
jgi:hypothetical protein